MSKGVLSVVTGNTPDVRGLVVDQLRRLRPDAVVLAVSIEDTPRDPADGTFDGGAHGCVSMSVTGRKTPYPLVQRYLYGSGVHAGEAAVRGGSGDPAVILRQDLLALRRSSARPHVVLTLPGNADLPSFLEELWRPRIDGSSLGDHFVPAPVVVGVEATAFLADIGCVHRTVRLWGGDGHGDPETRAEAAARQVEAADALVVPQRTAADSRRSRGAAALAGHLNGRAPLMTPPGGTSADPWLRSRLLRPAADPAARIEEWRARLEPVSVPRVRHGRHEGVMSVLWQARRPLHPDRLADALGAVMYGVVRGRGHLWLASRPDAVVTWRSAGAHLTMREAGRWLPEGAPDAWEAASAQRRALAAWFWHDYYGERRNELVFVGVDLDAARIREALDEALLTDAELAMGRESWSAFPDPLLSTDDAA